MVQFTTLVGAFALTISAVSAYPDLSLRQNLPDPSGQKNIGNGQATQFIGGQCLSAADCASGCCATLPRGGQTIGVCSGVGAQNQAGKQGCGFGGAGAGAGAGAGGNGGNNGNNGNNGNGNGNGNNGNGNGNNGNGNGNNGNGNGNNGNGNGNNGNNGNGNGNGNAGNQGGGAAGGTVVPSGLKPDPAGAANVGNGAGRQFITGGCNSDADCGSGCCALVNNGVVAPFGICSGVGANTQNGKQGCGFPQGGGQLPARSA